MKMEKRKFKVHHHVARKLIEHAREQERHVTPEELDDLETCRRTSIHREKERTHDAISCMSPRLYRLQ